MSKKKSSVAKYRRPKQVLPDEALRLHELGTCIKDYVSMTMSDWRLKWSRSDRWDVLMHDLKDVLIEIEERENEERENE